MSLTICDKVFGGPFELDDFVIRANQKACVYIIVRREGKPYDPRVRVLFVADSAGAHLTFSDHPSRAEWEAEEGEVGVYFYRPDNRGEEADRERTALVEEVVSTYDPPNGVVGMAATMS